VAPFLHGVGHSIHKSRFDQEFNDTLFEQFKAASTRNDIRKTHFFNGRFENIYLNEQQIPMLTELKHDARHRASEILGKPLKKMGCWFNAMGPESDTSLHCHDDDDEQLSGVYYVRVPVDSGKLIIHAGDIVHQHTPAAGQWVFFSPQTPHAVSKNNSTAMRLSVAFNFS